MNLKCSINNNNFDNSLVKFLIMKNFTFIDFGDLIKLNQNKLVIIDHTTNKEDFLKNIKMLNKNSFSTLLFLPYRLQGSCSLFNYRTVFYPISVINFENILHQTNNLTALVFKDVFLNSNNFILNNKTKKQTHLTETEFNIIKLLIEENIVKKEKLKTDILKVKIFLDTKSLESHLSRIRKKLQEIDSKISIISVDSKYIKIF